MNPKIKAHFTRGALYVLMLLVAVCIVPFLLAQRTDTKQKVTKGRGVRRLVQAGHALPGDIIVVTNTNDSGPGSLRNALAVANDGDTIDATGVSGTILLTSGELQINHNVTINGPGAGNLAVNGNATFRVFENFASNVTISGFTITNGLPPIGDTNGGGGILNHGGLTLSGSSIVSNSSGGSFNVDGGGINTLGGTLTVTNSVINDNGASGGGGCISGTNSATVTITGSTISGNRACAGAGIGIDNAQLTVMNSTISGNICGGRCQGGPGGGIAFSGGGTLTVTNSTISDNSGGGTPNGAGAGMFLGGGGTATVTDSTISDNSTGSAGPGGGVLNGLQMLTVTNSTISNNSTGGPGGGVANYGTLTLTNSTISGNVAPTGGGVSNGNGGAAQIGDTILNAGASGGTIANAGTFTSLGYNLASDNGGGVLTGPGDQINTDPVLGPLQDNGGPTFTHALLPGSPAIDAGDPSFTPPPVYDQRGPGYPRVVNGRIDKGSFEVQSGGTPTPTPTTTPSPTPTLTPRATPTPRTRPTPAPRP
jgi:Right handed beta helix region